MRVTRIIFWVESFCIIHLLVMRPRFALCRCIVFVSVLVIATARASPAASAEVCANHSDSCGSGGSDSSCSHRSFSSRLRSLLSLAPFPEHIMRYSNELRTSADQFVRLLARLKEEPCKGNFYDNCKRKYCDNVAAIVEGCNCCCLFCCVLKCSKAAFT